MAYVPLTFSYGQVLTSADLNQLAENDRVAEEFRKARTALPHMRVRHTAGQAVTGDGWRTVQMNTDPADGGASPQPWTITPSAVTLSETGLYLATVTTSASNAEFATRLVNTTPDTDVTLAQTTTGTTFASLSNQLTLARRLLAGDTLVWQVYSENDTTLRPDAAATPCYLDLIRLSD